MERLTKKILVIDDEPDISRAIKLTITIQEPNWKVVEASSARDGLKKLLEDESFDLVLLDLVMPDMSGFDVLKKIRSFSDIPVIMLTVRDDELDKVHGLELGADDYIVKPFGHLELMARIKSIFRRVSGDVKEYEKPYVVDDLKIDFNKRKVFVGDKEISLTATEYKVLEILARNAGRIVEKDTLLSRVWGMYEVDNPDYLKIYIHRLRSKIEKDPKNPKYLHTERGIGYWLLAPTKK